MKSVAISALAVAAAQAETVENVPHVVSHTPVWAKPFIHMYETIDFEKNNAGFADELNLPEDIRGLGKVCVDATSKGYNTLVNIVKKGQDNKALLAVESVGVVETIKSEVVEACQPYAEALNKFAKEKGTPIDKDDKKAAYIRNGFAQQYTFEMIDTIIDKDAYNYGKTYGKAFKLAANMDQESRANQYKHLESSKTAPEGHKFDMHTFSSEFWPAFLKTIGESEKFDVNDFIKCGDAQVSIGDKINEIKKNAGNTFLGRIGAQVKIAEEIASLASECYVEVELFKPIWKKIKADPIKTLLKIQHNGGISAGQLAWIGLTLSEDIQKTDYTLAGQAAGTLANIQYKDI